MSTDIKTQIQLAAVQQFNCTNCGAALEVLNARSKYISCQYCGTVLDVLSEEHQILKALDPPANHPPMSFIRLGQMAQFNGLDYQVIARTRWRQKYQEYWYEEGESGYSSEVWVYDEWLMLSEDRTYFYLIEDKDGYHRSEEIIPELPVLRPDNLRMRFYEKQPKKIIKEYGHADAIYFEGESNYQIAVGDRIHFSMFQDRRAKYSSEWRVDEKDRIIEVEFFKETPIARRKLLEALENNEEIQQIRAKEKDWKFVFRLAQFTFLALLIMTIYSFLSSGDTIFSQEIDAGMLAGDRTLISNPIQIDQKGLFELQLYANDLPTNSEMNIGVYILDADSRAINTLVQSFFYYTGVEGGESWTESNRKLSKIFKLDQAGTYYLQFFMDSEFSNMGTISIKVNKGIMLSRYFLIGLLICFIPLMISLVKKGSA